MGAGGGSPLFLLFFGNYLFLYTAFDDDVVSMSNASRYIEDPGFGYKDFARRGEEHLPTFRANVCIRFVYRPLMTKFGSLNLFGQLENPSFLIYSL